MTPGELTARIDRLCDRLAADGCLRDPVWREAFHAVPRHLFVPDRAWVSPNGPGEGHSIDRTTDPGRWWNAVYSDAAIVTQRDDGATDVTGSGAPSSSCSAPATVAEFLEHLRPLGHDRVLEVGTGTGWTAALLSHRVAARNVTTIDVDPAVAETAGKNLEGAGFAPRLVVGDGTAGRPDGAPFDRVHVAAGVAAVPYTWVAQTRPGGVIVLPFMPGYGFGWLACLHVLGDGTAVGGFPGFAGYMMLRGQRPSVRAVSDLPTDDYTESVTRLDPRRLAGDSHAADLVIAATVPDVHSHLFHGEGDEADECTLWLIEAGGTSWASVDYLPGADGYPVQQHGPRRLWDEAERAYLWWLGAGRPDRHRFGLTVSPDGQAVWLDEPAKTVRP